tara:strand:+ start:5653 stop:6285 length:633 start_codon:yes stop_codon:yes gene_type:complete
VENLELKNCILKSVSSINRSEIDAIIDIHRQELSGGFLSSLGNAALDILFSFAAESKHAILLILLDNHTNKKVIGFLLGALDTKKFYMDFIVKKFFIASLILLPKMISFRKIKKVFETLFYPTKKIHTDLPKSELLDIAILSPYQGQGLAKNLFYGLIELLTKENISSFKITTGESLINAQKFYEKIGAIKVDTVQVHKGENTFVYIYKI